MRHESRRSTRSKLVVLSMTLSVVGAATLVGCGGIAGNEPAVVVPRGDPELGRAALTQYACVTCHVVPGVRAPQTHIGPPLTAWAERNYIAGELPNEPSNLIRWIMDPQAVEPGTAMPDMGIDEATARDMAAYLYTLEE